MVRNRVRCRVLPWVGWAAASAGTFLVLESAAHAAPITVNARFTAPGGGCSFEEAVTALNDRVQNDCTAGNGNNDTITVLANTNPYLPTGINIGIRRSVIIQGAGISSTIIQFAGGVREGDRALSISGGPAVVVTFRNLTLRGADGNQLTGIDNVDATVTVQSSRITRFGFAGLTNNASMTVSSATIDQNGIFGELPLGGGVSNAGELFVGLSNIVDNFAAFGGGLADFGDAIIADTRFEGNEALLAGGAIYTEGRVQISYSIVEDNTAGDAGGGGITVETPLIFEQPGRIDMHHCAVVGNFTSGNGGGVFHNGQTTHLGDSTFSGNVAEGIGGAAYTPGNFQYMAFRHVTVTQNEAGVSGGGVTDGAALIQTLTSIQSDSNIISDNHAPIAPNVQGGFYTQDGLISVVDGSYNGCRVRCGDGPACVDPNGGVDPADSTIVGTATAPKPASLGPLTEVLFTDSAGSHVTLLHPLLPGSLGIDYRECRPQSPEQAALDQRGGVRPLDGDSVAGAAFDMGAYELDPNNALLKFEVAGAWTSSVPLSLNAARKTEGQFGLNVGGSGYRVLRSSTLKTPLLPATSALRLDVFVPPNQPNPYWLGAVQMYATCASANLYNAYIGQVELTGRPTNAFSTLGFTLPAAVRSALGQSRPDCFFSIAVNTNSTPIAPVLDNLRLVP